MSTSGQPVHNVNSYLRRSVLLTALSVVKRHYCWSFLRHFAKRLDLFELVFEHVLVTAPDKLLSETSLAVLPGSVFFGQSTGCKELLPVPEALQTLFPLGGLQRGSAVSIAESTASTSLLLALLSSASAAKSWCAVVGFPTLGGAAAAEFGLTLDRLIAVPQPGNQWPNVTSAFLDACDVVAVHPPGFTKQSDLRRLIARTRERRAVLVVMGASAGVQLRLSVRRALWYGVGRGHGFLRARRVTVNAEGQGIASRPRHIDLWLPDETGNVTVAEYPQRTELSGSVTAITGATYGHGPPNFGYSVS